MFPPPKRLAKMLSLSSAALLFSIASFKASAAEAPASTGAVRAADPVHIDPQDLAVRTWHISEDGLMATVDIDAAARNQSAGDVSLELDLAIIDPDGLPITTHAVEGVARSKARFAINRKLAIPHPRLWSPDTPNRYRLVARSFVKGRLTDRQEIPFDIREDSESN